MPCEICGLEIIIGSESFGDVLVENVECADILFVCSFQTARYGFKKEFYGGEFDFVL